MTDRAGAAGLADDERFAAGEGRNASPYGTIAIMYFSLVRRERYP
jgi:hypothetical protein